MTDDLLSFAKKDKSINFTGYVDDPLIYLHKAEIFVAPILSGGGTKLKVLEAMALGKAIVCTSIGCEGISGEHGKHYLVTDEYKTFAFEILRLLGDKELRNKLQTNAHKLCSEKYSFSSICEKLNLAYDNLSPKN